jgi:hypothetical protein
MKTAICELENSADTRKAKWEKPVEPVRAEESGLAVLREIQEEGGC